MDNAQSAEPKDAASEPPAAEVLKPRADDGSSTGGVGDATIQPVPRDPSKQLKRRAYHPSHRATFISLAVVVLILAVNAGVIAFILKNKSGNSNQTNHTQVTVSQSVLDQLGVNRTAVGNSGIELTIGPNTQFNGKVVIEGETSIAGQLRLSRQFSAADATLTQLEAGKTTLSDLNVNGAGTISDLTLRNSLLVAGPTQLQGPVTLSQLLTVNNSVNVVGNLSVGSVLSADQLTARSLVSTSTITVGGHIITSGSAPAVSAGSGLGSNGTVSISGNDAAGTIALNIGVGGSCSSTMASVTFHNKYSSTPHVVVTPIGIGITFFVNRSSTGFSVGCSGGSIAPGGYAFDYIVEQ